MIIFRNYQNIKSEYKKGSCFLIKKFLSKNLSIISSSIVQKGKPPVHLAHDVIPSFCCAKHCPALPTPKSICYADGFWGAKLGAGAHALASQGKIHLLCRWILGSMHGCRPQPQKQMDLNSKNKNLFDFFSKK